MYSTDVSLDLTPVDMKQQTIRIYHKSAKNYIPITKLWCSHPRRNWRTLASDFSAFTETLPLSNLSRCACVREKCVLTWIQGCMLGLRWLCTHDACPRECVVYANTCVNVCFTECVCFTRVKYSMLFFKKRIDLPSDVIVGNRVSSNPRRCESRRLRPRPLLQRHQNL